MAPPGHAAASDENSEEESEVDEQAQEDARNRAAIMMDLVRRRADRRKFYERAIADHSNQYVLDLAEEDDKQPGP